MIFDLSWYGQIYILVAVAILEKSCMAFADMQQLYFLLGERFVAHRPLVFKCNYFLEQIKPEISYNKQFT